jgi:hypothetical protein
MRHYRGESCASLALPYLALGSTPAAFVREWLAIRREFKRDGVDAVLFAGWRRPIGKDISLVSTAWLRGLCVIALGDGVVDDGVNFRRHPPGSATAGCRAPR